MGTTVGASQCIHLECRRQVRAWSTTVGVEHLDFDQNQSDQPHVEEEVPMRPPLWEVFVFLFIFLRRLLLRVLADSYFHFY